MHHIKPVHKCELQFSYDQLPQLPPTASRWAKLAKHLRDFTLVSEDNPRTRYFFKSKESVSMEKRRQLKYSPRFVFHPFSTAAMYREIIMAMVWMFSFTFDSYIHAFAEYESWFSMLGRCVDLLEFSHICACFFAGYYDYALKEAVLDYKRIRRRYLLTYFTIDFVKVIPLQSFSDDVVVAQISSFKDLLLICRIYSMFQFMRQITLMFDLGDLHHELMCLILGALVLINSSSSWIFLIPKTLNEIRNATDKNSWTYEMSAKNITMATKYVQSLHKATAHLFACSQGMWMTDSPQECVLFAIIILCGLFYIGYVTALILELSKSQLISESRYDKMYAQLNIYLSAKKFPLKIRTKLYLYYRTRFKEHYFNEDSILETLSEHLRHEVTLYHCRPLIESATFFEGLPKSVVGHIMACLQRMVLLPNELAHDNSQADHLYFIARGTLSLVVEGGKELKHIYDGNFFGELSIMAECSSYEMSPTVATMRYVAVEYTEIYTLAKAEFEKYVLSNKLVKEKLIQIATEHDEHIARLDEETHVVKNKLTEKHMNKVFVSQGLRRK